MIAIQQISVSWLQCDYFVFFFLYILSGSIYRQQLFRLLKLNKRNNDILPLAVQEHVIHQMPGTARIAKISGALSTCLYY